MIRAVLFSASALMAATAALAAEPLNLNQGEVRTLPVHGTLTRIVVGKRGIIDAMPGRNNRLRVTGTHPGTTTLALFGAGGKALGSYDVYVHGPDYALATQFAGDPDLAKLSVDRAGDGLVLKGEVPDRQAHGRATKMAEAYGDAKITDLTSVSGKQMVAVDVRFAAISSGTLKALGFSFAKLGGAMQGALAAPDTIGSFSLPNTNIPAPFDPDMTAPIQSAFNLILSNPANGVTGVLSALSSAGLSEVLAQPTLIVRSGEEASFLAGGDVPVPVPQGGNANGAVTIEYREFGVRLNVAADILSDKRIVLKLTPEVSELDYTNGVRMQGYVVPGLRRRTATTTVELGSGQSFIIAGLNYSNSNVASEKLPLLADIPVIGALFRRTRNTQERQELVIIATPRLVDPLKPGDPVPLSGIDKPFDPGLGAMLTGSPVERRVSELGLKGR